MFEDQDPAKPSKRSRRASPGAIAESARKLDMPVGGLVPRRPRGSSGARRGAVRHAGVWRALCLCEISNFPSLRRHLGKRRADLLAGELADRMTAMLADARAIAIGRELIEIQLDRPSASAAAEDVEKLRCEFSRSNDIDGEQHLFSLSVGLAAAPLHDVDDVRLAEAAESALDKARDESRVVMLDLSRADLAFDRLTLMRELPRAIREGEMFLQYQPKVHIRRQEIASAEALVRWRHPERGLILPGDFISVAEEAGEIAALTLWTLRQVIDDQRRLAAAGHDLTLFLNISGVLLADRGFVHDVCEIVSNSNARIGFEITETSVIRDPESAIRHLEQFAGIGVTLAIDDYGAGLSSLAYLKQLPASELKIDKLFVMQLTSSNRDPLIVRSTIDLAHALEMEVTAEGVETPAALALLSVMGCDMAQGFLISRPIAIDALVRYLDEQAHLSASSSPASSFSRPESFWRQSG